jgi:hypothetical protein
MGRYRNQRFNGKQIVQHLEQAPPHTLAWTARHTPNPPEYPYIVDKFRDPTQFFHTGSSAMGDAAAWTDFHTAFA